MYKKTFIVLMIFGLGSTGLLILGPSTFANMEPVDLTVGDAERGKETYGKICVACHGDRAQGNELLNAPKLAGQEPWYIARQLKNFATGVRGADPRDIFGMQMRPMALTLKDDRDIADIVAYISTISEAADQ